MATPIAQPTLFSDKGLILVVGIQAGRDFGALVQPFASNGSIANYSGAKDLVDTFVANALPGLLDCMSNGAEVTYVEASGMVHGQYIPFRTDFATGAQPGTRGPGLMEGQVAALVLMYCDSNAPGPSGKLQIGKAFINGLCEDDVDEDIVDAAVVSQAESFEADCCTGLLGALATWWRVGAARRTAAAELPRVIRVDGQNICATQRRRLVRH